MMIPKNDSSDLSKITNRAMEDIQNLKAQIEKLLAKMEVVDNIKSVPTLPLPSEGAAISRNVKAGDKPSIRMERKDSKKEGRGKVLPSGLDISMRLPDLEDSFLSKPEKAGGEVGTTSDLEILEESTKKVSAKYVLVDDSVFFVPTLERCILGMTVVNESETKLSLPMIRLNLLSETRSSSDFDDEHSSIRSFLYDTRVFLKGQITKLSASTSAGSQLPIQDSFSQYKSQGQEFFVAPGSEVLITANFAYPFQFSSKENRLRLLVTILLGGKELWSRQLLITNHVFGAAVIDFVFKKHHLDIVRALEVESQGFGLERIAISEEDKFPKKSLERFMFSYGFESIESFHSGIDTTVEFYTTNQPSIFWGTSVRIEACSRKQALARCLFTFRTKEQVQTLLGLFKTWLKKEVNKDKRHGFVGLKLYSLNSKTDAFVKESFEKEINLIQRLVDVKLVLHNEHVASGSRKAALRFSNKNEPSGVDSSWLYEYALSITKTDAIFVDQMKC